MKNSHIYKARGGKFMLIITTGPSIAEGVVSEQTFNSKNEAKAAAKAVGAKPWNY